MVVLHYKKTDLNQFLYETHTAIKVDDLIVDVCNSKQIIIIKNNLSNNFTNEFENIPNLIFSLVNNMRLKLDRAAVSLEDLATKGPMKPEELRGLKDYDEYVKNEDITTINGLKKMPPRVGIREVPDDTNYRTSFLISEELSKMMMDESMKTKMMIHKQQVDYKVCLTMKMM